MGKFEKQLKYSIRKVSIGAASVVIGAFYLAMGAGVVHAETNTPTDGGASHSRPSPESETSQPNGLTSSSYGAEPAQNPGGLQAGAVHSVKEEMKTITRTIKYVNASDESKEVSATVTQTVTLTRKQGTEEWTTGKWEAQTSPTVNGFGAPDKSTIESKEVTSTTENEDVIVYYTKLDASSTLSTRGRRSKRDVENPPAGGTSNTSTGTETAAGASTENNETLNSALTERKGATVKPDQPGVNVPKGNEHGAHDPSAHLSFNDPGHTATVEEMWKIIQHMPDDFQNNERSYLRNMDTLGKELRFDKTAENPEGVPLKPGEIRELHDFGGWHAIDKDGTQGKFVIGRKNEQGYFTGWHKVGETSEGIPIMEQGGMLGADALDNIYVHEQALDRRFDYMLMLVKGRTRANRNDTVADNSTYDPRAQNERAETAGANYNKLPFLEKDKFNKYSPGVVGYNGIEKKFTAFSTKYGSRVRVDFVTGYISDINDNKGSYRIVIKAQNSKGEETQVYDETISRVAEIVQNEELYKKGLNVEAAHANILKFLKDEFNYRVNKIKNPKVKANSLLRGTKEKDYTPEQQKVYDQIVEEATEEAKKQGDIVMNVTEDFLSITKAGKKDSEWKKTFTNTAQSTAKLSNDLNNLLKNADKDTPNTPTWLSSGSSQAKADDRAYRLLTTLIPGAKKITYHVNDDQLEVETDKYTYTAARNGSKEVGIQGSDIAATLSADAYNANPQTFDSENTNTKANNLNHGWARAGSEEFQHFSRFIGVDKGIERTNVISDEELSAKIKEAVGPGYSQLGKAGYFSTADIPLGTDIVSYTVQVIPSDNERVGVNPQSSRIQYNMPILADFSVIQDTVEPSKEVARRIITKLKEKGKITGDEEKKIREEIDKSKKTSELRTAMSGDVKVKYQAVDGTLLTLKNTVTGQNETDLGKKDTDGTYIAQKDQLLGTDYDVTGKKLATLTTADGKRYRLKRSLADNSVEDGRLRDSASDTGTITTTGARTVTYVYEEYTAPPTGKGLVHFKKQVNDNTTEALNGYPDISLEGDVGTEFSSESVNAKITALKKAGYEIVSDTFTNGDKTIDSVTDTDGQDPSQVYNVTVREKVVTVTTPPTPNTPVDPTVPEGPKWPETGLAKSDLEKEVTRTITYVKKETADGPEIADAKPTKKQTAHFKRSVTYNLVTKVVTPGDWGSTDNTLTAVPTEKLEGYIADRASVEAVTVPDTSGNITEKVVYTKLGSWVPNLPKGVTPPEGTDMTPKPYPNHPTDPTKPGDPTPGLIPYVPGYTPNVGGTPLVPKNPTDLTEGYTPPTPTDPKTNIEINYTPDPQKAVVKVYTIRDGVKIELPNEKVSIDSGIPDAAIPSTKLDEKIKDLEKRGYIVDNKTPLKGETFDKVKDSETGDPSQVYELILRERTSVETETKSVTRTIKYYKIDETNGSKVEVDNGKLTNTKTAEFTREVTTNLATGLTTIGAWSDKQTLDEVKTPVLTGYIADKVKVPSSEVTADTESFEEEVVYKKIGNWVPKVPGVENPTPIPYPNDPNDPTKPKYPDYPTKPGNPGETPNPQPGTPDGETPGTPEKPKTPPVIPYVPGYTPKIGDKPLEPVDPNNPETGYRVPPIPETPENDTPIEYEKDPQKAVVKVFNTTTGTEVELPKEKVELSGKTGEPIPADSVITKIAELEKRGYVVENKDLLNNQKFDKEKDPTDGDPTQVFKLLVKERTVEVTEPKNPNDPVDPDKPEGPKWPETGLAKSDLEKEVTRTITYVKKETADGPEIADAKPTKKQTAHFKRSATYNLVTKVVTPGEWTSTDKTLEAVPTEKLDGYVANVPSVEEVETNVNSTNLDRKVVYTKLGSWVPKVPGVETPTPLPYPNHPTDPTKPGDPTDPNTPNVPVIPYVPGYTPKIGETPLQPKVPNDPTQGYIPPAVPTEPGTNTDITYVADPQKAVVKVFNTTTGTEVELPAEKVSIDNGTTDSAIPTDSVTAKIADLEKRGYVVENKDLLNNQKFDKEKDPTDGDPTQVFKLLVKERTVEVTEPKNPNDPVDPDKPEGPKWPETGLAKSDLEKEVTRTITYVKKETADGPEIADAKPTKKQTAHFKRSATYNLVTKVVTPGEWTSTDKTLEAVPTEKLDGYVANVPSVEEVETNVNSTNLDRKVVYTKLGSWVPKVPGVETPTPLPYPNHPTDPTKPGDPTDPNTPNVPVIPYVPGYTPKIGETPLQPKVPNDPTQGYIPPAVPTEPGTNTDITYVADPQKAVVKVVKVEGEGEKQVKTPLENDTVFINNGSTNETIPTTDLNTKIADLEKRGYVVENKTLLENQKFDNKKDPETGDPTQVFELLVKERTVTVTEPKNPNDPVDPDKPEGPKWPETGLAKSDLEKEVTRTITYVKKETADGPEIADAKPTKKQTAHFKRSATYNLVTKVVTPGEWTSTDKTLEAVPTEKLDGYVANVPSVEEVETNVNSTNLDRKVVYTKLGSWVPKVPGVETPTPLPYPNHPTDPTKPGDPTDPNTPNVPVIPYVPGYTPKIGETPLQPKVPNDPTQGYIPPAVPTEPGTNTDITYAADPQKAIVKYVVEGTTKVLHKEELTGDSGTTINYTTANKLAELKVLGYELVTDGFTTATDKNFDKDKTVDQTFEVTVKPKVVDVPPFEPTNPKGDDNPKPEPGKPIDPKNPNGPKWTKALIDKLETTKHVTRTITYVEDGTDKEVANKATDKVTFTRSLKVNVVTGDVVDPNVAWTSNDTTFDEVTSPVVKGYVLKANQGSEDGLVSTDGSRVAASENLTATSENQNLKVVYTKLGSWVPKVPGVETPTPLPYPNHPTDPTKPVEPEYPQPGTPVEPNTPKPPVIPYVPGYTPKTPDGNPLVPVDPEHPENGYKVPPVPTEPGNDTPITYVADPQKAIVKYVVEGTTKVLHKEELTGDSGTTINYTTANKLAELKVLGYELVTDGFTTATDKNFDKDKTVDQTFEVTVKPKVVDVPPFEPTNPKGDDNPKPEPGKPIDPKNPNGPKWTKALIDKLETTKHVTRTITYVEDGTDKEVANKATDKVTFTRSLKVNVVTGDVVDPNVAWTSNDTTFDEVTSPVVKGYVLKANQGSEDGLVSTDGSRVVASTNLTEASENQNLKVVYTKLGSWVPKVPGVETPTPLPYPNHPTDPTKPGEPEYPQPGTPVEPNTPKPPVIPYVPGYTPKTPDGNPLVPVDPEHPENGYKVPPVPTEPGNDTPITYEKVPDKPKPEITGTKEVTRTIKYVDEKGNELAKPSTDKVTFTRNGSDWNAVDGDSTFDAVKSPVVKGYILKDSAQKVVEKETVKSDAKDETITVVYTKVGSYVPKVPEGVTPPSPTPYDNDPQDPSKVVTPNPEKPQDPNDPNSPKVPVIPYVPGHTPKTPDGNPLVPVDPEHPEKGYNVPPVPTIPDQDTPITYVKDGQQKAITSFVDPKGNVLETPITETGDSNTPLTKNGEVEATIAKLKLKGYDVETNTYPPTGTFDNDPKVDQYFKVTLVPHVEPVKPFDPTDPNDPNKPVPGQPIDPKNPEGPKWNEELIKQVTTKKEVTRTINYVDEAGNKVSEPSTDKVTFTREAKINVVTGEITYGDWKAVGGDSTFDRVTSPVVKGYILKDPSQKEVAEIKGITPTVANQTIEVVYKKLGSWVPKVPGVETPTPLPYPNHPTDPTKPGDPTDPNTPNVPVIPYVPGYTPKIGETPLQPKVPNDPTQGYIPPVPTEPGNDTPIEYVKVPNTPSPEEPVKPTPESNHITIWVDENGKPLKPEKPGTHEPGNIPGYRFITTTTKDGVTIHKFEKITPVEPNNPVPQKPTTPIPTPQDPTIPTPESQIPTPNIPEANTPTSETSRREELPNTGTEANANLAALGLLGALSGFGLLARKKKED